MATIKQTTNGIYTKISCPRCSHHVRYPNLTKAEIARMRAEMIDHLADHN